MPPSTPTARYFGPGDAFAQLGRHTGPTVAHTQDHDSRVEGFELNFDIGRAITTSVLQQIAQHAAQQLRHPRHVQTLGLIAQFKRCAGARAIMMPSKPCQRNAVPTVPTVPGLTKPPASTVTVPSEVPVPVRVPVEPTVMAEARIKAEGFTIEPVRLSVPALTKVGVL